MNLAIDTSALMAAYGEYFILAGVVLILAVVALIKVIRRRRTEMNQVEVEALSEKARQIWGQIQDFDKREQEDIKRLQERNKAEKKALQDKYDYLYDKLGWRA